MPPNLNVDAVTHNVTVFDNNAFRRTVKQGHKGGVLI